MECEHHCRHICSWIEGMPYHRKYALPKECCPELPVCFRETLMGEMIPGATRQFRGPSGAHVHEFADHWIFHRDIVNASDDPVGHLMRDAPEYLVSMAIVFLTSMLMGRKTRDRKVEAAIAGGLSGLFALLLGKLLKSIDEERVTEEVREI
ncbi:MAG: hypothetical protein N3G75_08115 [Methanothrix sp.]|nr:hypothetical protein [Methanothrix sp.]MCX8207778.1 hypothetical protein [Methanothrix sp.]